MHLTAAHIVKPEQLLHHPQACAALLMRYGELMQLQGAQPWQLTRRCRAGAAVHCGRVVSCSCPRGRMPIEQLNSSLLLLGLW